MFSGFKKRLPPWIKDFLLRGYNAFWEMVVFFEAQYTKLYVKTCVVKSNKMVLCNCHGKPYGDNPKYIVEECLARKMKWDFVWLTNDLGIALPEGVRPVKYGSHRAMREIASAKVVVDNVRNTPRPPKRKGQIYLQTWHGGLAFKLVEGAATGLHASYVKDAKLDGANCDGIISACSLQTEDFKKNFWLNERTEILEVGLPRNDKLFNEDVVSRTRKNVRDYFHLKEQTCIVLYMPTFRDDHSTDGYAIDYPGVVGGFEKRFGKDFVMLVRMHPNVQKQDSVILYDDKIINATRYPDAQELYMAADYLITDYSSSAFDFALMNKPVFVCTLDLDRYSKDRGLSHIFWKCSFPKAYTNRELIQCIEGFSEEEYQKEMQTFATYWRPFDKGDSAKQVVDWICAKIS